MKFKVGDRVKYIGNELQPDLEWLEEGTIVDSDEGSLYPYLVSFENDPHPMWDWSMHEQDLELV